MPGQGAVPVLRVCGSLARTGQACGQGPGHEPERPERLLGIMSS